MTRFQYLLIKLAEEAGEVSKEALKTAQFGYDSYNPHDVSKVRNEDKLITELLDMLCIVDMLKEEFDFSFDVLDLEERSFL